MLESKQPVICPNYRLLTASIETKFLLDRFYRSCFYSEITERNTGLYLFG